MAEMVVQGLLEFWPCKNCKQADFGLPTACNTGKKLAASLNQRQYKVTLYRRWPKQAVSSTGQENKNCENSQIVSKNAFAIFKYQNRR